ncbi:MAG TPA: GreA/GreB family elongation factor [Candidatus Hydrogenedentes bacterium]|nr:GreA/GreB family elongation factor [Candidatus Hydrogenedentota bacterium]
MEKHIWITAQDKQRLTECLAKLQELPDERDLPHIRELQAEIDRAFIISDPSNTPKDVVTMRSRVRLTDTGTGNSSEYVLVYPSERNPEAGCISVLAPLGTAMLGYRVGDEFEVDLPRGKTSFKVAALLYQPESKGDFPL